MVAERREESELKEKVDNTNWMREEKNLYLVPGMYGDIYVSCNNKTNSTFFFPPGNN